MENKVTKKQIRQKLLVYPLIFGIFFVVIYFILAPSGEKTEAEKIQGLNTELPDPENQTIYADKKTAYEQEQLRKQQEVKRLSLEDYAFSLTGKDSSDLKTNDELDFKIEETQVTTSDQEFTDRSPLVSSGLAYQNMNRELSGFYQQSQDSEKKQLEQQIEDLTKRLEEKESPAINPDRQIEMIEKSYQLAAKYLNTDSHSDQTPSKESPASDKPDEIISPDEQVMLYNVTNNKENVVSRLPQQVSDSVFLSDYAKPRHEGFYSAIKSDNATNRNTIRACIFENQTLIFGNGDNQEVRFRLLENVRAGKLLIPRNSLFTGNAKIRGGRLDITINSIEYAGNIIAVKINVFDLDGQKGIRAWGSEETNALKEATSNMGQQLGTSITFTQNAGQQVAADLAKGAIETGSQYLSKKMKTVKIHLKADHEVLLLASDK